MIGGDWLSKEDIINRLNTLNDMLITENKVGSVVIVGGAAMALLSEDVVRRTQDIDIMGYLPLSVEEVNKLQVNTDVTRIYFAPDLSELEDAKLFKLSNLDITLLSWSDLAITKFFTKRDKDLHDLRDVILPNVTNYSNLLSRLDYYKVDYIGNLDDMNLNINHMEVAFSGLKERRILALPFEELGSNVTLEEWLSAKGWLPEYTKYLYSRGIDASSTEILRYMAKDALKDDRVLLSIERACGWSLRW